MAKHQSEGNPAARGVSSLGLDDVICGINIHPLRVLLGSGVSHPEHLCKGSERQ